MMQLSDIIQLVVLCALIFFPLGYITRHYIRRIRTVLRMLFIKPRYVKPVGTWRSASTVKAKQKND
ncbi:cellulose biosynthesis protein BcsF [Pseudescherichia vulneris]|uniref:cellulose biosynthesis protein BcsF n=1 Tax=Pseudescherichia vulneris TaxID=566 RepID=UPI00227C3F0C|nr:cellulose biosynthesis protein BcsF [Pseudescherichia vulneris]WAH50784.1 cellulose biosynthesis protein BcsF [Pseudescherichia vulneris]